MLTILNELIKFCNEVRPVTRIAPTPSGYLHLGNVFNFILTYSLVKSQDGLVGLHIHDNDQSRVRDEYINDIFNVLDLLEIKPDFGPVDINDFKNNYSQGLNKEKYLSKLKEFKNKDLTFVCECTRKTLQDYIGRPYPGICKDRKLEYINHTNQIRLKLRNDSPVFWRKDDFASYHLSSLYDDEKDNINTWVRGEDLTDVTKTQLEIIEQHDIFSFPKKLFIHHELLTDENDQKISKSSLSSQDHQPINNQYSQEQVFDLFSNFINSEIRVRNIQEVVEYFQQASKK